MLYQLSHPAAPDFKDEVSKSASKTKTRRRSLIRLYGCVTARLAGLRLGKRAILHMGRFFNGVCQYEDVGENRLLVSGLPSVWQFFATCPVRILTEWIRARVSPSQIGLFRQKGG